MIHVALLLSLALGQDPAAPTLVQILDSLKQVVSQLQTIVDAQQPAPLPPPPAPVPETQPILTAADLQAALDKGGDVTLVAGTVYNGAFVIAKPVTIHGNGATIYGNDRLLPAVFVKPGLSSTDITFEALTFGGIYDQRIVLIGLNDTGQTDATMAPQRVTFVRCSIPTYRGKKAIEVNGAFVTFDYVTIHDVFDPAGRDSQTIAITANSPGDILIDHSDLQGGVETVMVGGDTTKTPGLVTKNITIRNTRLSHDLAWKPATLGTSDATHPAIKNLLELKTGVNVLIQNVVMEGAWKSGQDGWAFMITPKSGGQVQNVTIEDVTIDKVGGCVNVTGVDFTTTPRPPSTTGVVMRRITCTASSATYGGRGSWLLATSSPVDLLFDAITFVGDGTAAVTTNGTIQSFTLTNSRMTLGKYGFFTQGTGQSGYPYAGNLALAFTSYSIIGNTFAGWNSTLKTNLGTGNTYVDRATFDALIAQ